MLGPNDNSIACEKLLASKKALFIGAHPDDIEFRAGGLVYLMRQRGIEVTFAIATSGGKRLPKRFRQALERVREKQQRRAACVFGGINVVFFGYRDGALLTSVGPFAEDLKSLIAGLQPDVALCWDPEFIFTPHPDHQAAADAARMATTGLDTCWYGTTQPSLWVGLDREALGAKVRALKAHRTETPWFYFDLRMKKRMIAAMRHEGSKIGCDYAETFRFIQPHPQM